MSSKRRQHPYGEAVSQGRCCTNGTCSRVGQPSFVNLLQDDVFPPSCKGSRRKTEGRQESGTDVGSAAAAQHTHTHINTHAQGTEHHGEDNYERPTETGNFSTALNNVIKQGRSCASFLLSVTLCQLSRKQCIIVAVKGMIAREKSMFYCSHRPFSTHVKFAKTV